MVGVLDKVVSESQSAFLKGRQIFDGVLIANEVIHTLKSEKSNRGGVVLKLDFSKAYDCVRWDFLLMVLVKMGFGESWCTWIYECVSSAKVSILINGSPTKEFLMKKGLRQGDPISPFLFITVTEVLHLIIIKASENGLIEGIDSLLPQASLTHLQFADDTILFLRPSVECIENTKRVLRCFEICSGLSINFRKSCLVGINTDSTEVKNLASICGCKEGEFPFKYLGFPLGADPRKISTWEPVIERFRAKLTTWKSVTKQCWGIALAAALWSLWLARNERVFRNLSKNQKDLLVFTKMRALIWIKALNEKILLKDDFWWDDPIASLGPSNSELLQDWIPPESGCMKFNVDGSFNTVAAGCGGVLRSSNGDMRAIFSGPVEYFGSDFAELMAVKTALSIFLEAGWMGKVHLIIESDSQVVLNWISNPLLRPWKWWCFFDEIENLVRKLGSVNFSYIPRNRNNLADHLAKAGIGRS
ncbi:hypothetical protein GQ457_15G025740 [Hibiscus cannabinus]